MNTLMLVSHRLFAAALVENADARRLRSRSDKPVTIEVAARDVAPPWPKMNPATARVVRFDSRLHA